MTYEEIIDLALRKSLFYPSAEIYSSSPAGFWNFGPYGSSIRRKIIEFWRKELVQKENMLEIYGSQIMPKDVFIASGHLTSFNDPITQCKKCHALHRADDIISQKLKKAIPEATPVEKLDKLIKKHKIKCPKCNSDLKKVRSFNMMIKTEIGALNNVICYLRPETCQSIFLDFNRLVKTNRITLPKGIAQVGRSFRNEISPRQSLFREVEFSQMEIEIFFNPKKINEVNINEVKNYKVRILKINKKDIQEIKVSDLVSKKIVSGKLIAYYLARVQQLYEKLGINKKNLRFREVGKDEKPFYSKETWDFEILTNLGWIEVIANNYRTDYDLKGHAEGSKKDLGFSEDGKKFIPHIFEISGGVDRTFYAIIDNAFKKEKERIVLKLNPKISPFDIAVFPLVNKSKLPTLAKKIQKDLQDSWLETFYDDSGSIGRRYRRMDEIGVKYCITIDFDSLKKKDITIRDRDTMKQVRVKIKDLKTILFKLLNNEIKIEKAGKLIK